MQIEAGKYYRTRRGGKVGPMFDTGGNSWPFVSEGTQVPCWTRLGSLIDAFHEHPEDLVAEWFESPSWIENRLPQDEPTSPIRAITKREIVSGTYGIVTVGKRVSVPDCNNPDAAPEQQIDLQIGKFANAAEIVAAARVLIEIAEAMSENQP